MALSEFEVIRRFFTHRAPSAVLGVGDDAAILRARRRAAGLFPREPLRRSARKY